MTGPPDPWPNPVPGSNAIWSFEVGVSPIGTISWFDFWTTVISQYANSPIMTQLLDYFSQDVDQTENFDHFFDYMWNVDTAQGYGLDAIGRKVGVSRTLSIPGGSTTYLGFNEASSWTGFNQGGFYTGATLTTNFNLLDPDYRTLIYAKCLGNICDGSIPKINSILLQLFPPQIGPSYVVDNQDMTMTYTFEFAPTSVQLAIIETSGVLPNPDGVTVLYSHL